MVCIHNDIGRINDSIELSEFFGLNASQSPNKLSVSFVKTTFDLEYSYMIHSEWSVAPCTQGCRDAVAPQSTTISS